MYTGEPISWTELHAWAQLSGVQPTMDEAIALRAMAAESERVAAETLRKQAKK